MFSEPYMLELYWRYTNWARAPDGQIFSALWSIVDLINNLCLPHFWWRVKASYSYLWSHGWVFRIVLRKYYSLRKVEVVGSLLVCITSPVKSSWLNLQYWAWTAENRMDLKSNLTGDTYPSIKARLLHHWITLPSQSLLWFIEFITR